jgi:phosphoglycerate dehydrogenase-like enzyme
VVGLLTGAGFVRDYGARIETIAREAGREIQPIPVPTARDARLDPADAARVDIAYFSGDVYPDASPAFFAAAFAAEKLHWMHCFNAGTDHPIFARLAERGVVLTNSPGASAIPIAQTAIAGLLALARRLPVFAAAQRERRWLEQASVAAPPDLATQTLVVVGLGGIGSEVARLGRALGLHVVGVRRTPPGPDAPIDEHVPPDRLASVLPRADWLALACPLNEETRGWIDAEALALLPAGAHLLNVARGEVVEEGALCAALEGGRLAGAYLDVFAVEPLPEVSPLWSMPNVIVTPHSASLSAGTRARQAEVFLANLARWVRDEPLAHRVDS